MEISASGYPERQMRRNADGSFTIPGLELEPMQCRIFVAPAENPERAPLLWLESLARRWGALEPLDSEKSDPVSKPSKWIIPLEDGWMAEQPGTGVRKNVKLGTFDVMGLDSAHTVYFRKTVKLPESWKNRRIELLFDSPARFFTGVFPKGSLRINRRKLLMNFNREFNDLATPVTVPSDGILNLQLRVDGAEKWEKASRRPASWGKPLQVRNYSMTDDCIRLEPGGKLPQLIARLPLPFEAARYKKFSFELKLPEGANPVGKLYWSNGKAPFSETRSIHWKTVADGNFHKIELELSLNPEWRGAVDALRLDLIRGKVPAAGTVEFRNAGFSR